MAGRESGEIMGGRPTLPEATLDRIRRERLEPRLHDPFFLHLRAVRRGLGTALRDAPLGRALDLYCGAQPYRPLLGDAVVAVDIDRHFGLPDVEADMPLPFADDAFDTVLCTQTLYLRSDDQRVIDEILRVLRPGGLAVVTVPHRWQREGLPVEHRYREEDLFRLFGEFDAVDLAAHGGTGAAWTYRSGRVLDGARRRWPWLRRALHVPAALVNLVGWAIDAGQAMIGRRSAVWIVTARKGA